MKRKNIVGIIARVIVGLVFIASAVTKYISIDAVDLFVYEHQLFPWAITTFATRLLIVAEFCVGVMLLLGIYPKQTKWIAVVMLIGFTLYVLLKPLLFDVDQENCHCFGTVILLNDTQTLIKNIILLLIARFMFWNKGAWQLEYKTADIKTENGEIKQVYRKTLNGFLYSHRRYITIVLFAVAFIAANTIIMPEPIQSKVYPKAASVDQEKFEELMQTDSVESLGVMHGKKILCLYSTGCKYCKRAAMRLDVVKKKYDLADSSLALVFWGNNAGIDTFFVRTGIDPLPHTLVDPVTFLQATKGRQPVIVLMNDGKAEKLLRYPNINEKDIQSFFKKED